MCMWCAWTRPPTCSRASTIDPDVILIDLESPSRDVLEQMFQVSRAVRRPVAMFVDQSDRPRPKPPSMPASLPISSVGCEGAHQEHPRSLHLALQFLRPLRDELERARTALEERKVIDRAKAFS